jgi:hypothetical protein
MKKTCSEVLEEAKGAGQPLSDLELVARNFIELQQRRTSADYDNSIQWSRTEALRILGLATDGFAAWRRISSEDAAQDYLLRLFLPKMPRV